MRLKFSLRCILAVIAVFAVLLYVCVVRPTMLANRFVAAVKDQETATVNEFLGGTDWRDQSTNGIVWHHTTGRDHLYVELFPRDLSDWLRCRRRIVLRIARHLDNNGQHVEWSEDIDLVSRPTGISIWPAEREF